MAIVCPLPKHWSPIYLALLKAAERTPGVPPPPKPLILAGWAYSSDAEKNDRWRATIQWAEKWGFSGLIPDLSKDMMHVVEDVSTDMMHDDEELSSVPIGPGYGPMYLPWNFNERPLITAVQAREYLEKIKGHWHEIAEGVVREHAKPIMLTGAKYRRLVCAHTGMVDPPWGTWSRLDGGPNRRSFTVLRKVINALIEPHMVDHIDFVGSRDKLDNHGI